MHLRPASIRLVGALLVAGALAVPMTGVALASSSRARAPQAVARCGTGQLVDWMNTTGNGYAGGVTFVLRFTNLSGHACALYGFPGVSAVNLAGQQIGDPATRQRGTPYHTVTVVAGGTVNAQLQVVDTGNYPKRTCKPTTAAGWRVYAAGLKTSGLIPFPISVCSNPHSVSISVGPTFR